MDPCSHQIEEQISWPLAQLGPAMIDSSILRMSMRV
jgi:hypothetical protein